LLGATRKRIKTALDGRYTAGRPSTKNASYDLFNPARIYQWAAAIHHVRETYASELGGRKPHLLRPQRFTDKMQWRKLFDLNPVYAVISDKFAARDFIAERVGPDVLIPLLWVGNDPAAVPFDTLDPPYVVKSTHASGHTIMVRQRQDVDASAAVATFKDWLATCYAAVWEEPGYLSVPRRLMVERMLLATNGSYPLERRFFVFHGRVKFLQTTFRDETGAYHRSWNDRELRPLDWYLQTPNTPELFTKPKRHEEMVAIAECLGRDFDHLRVDMYEADDRIWVGELTPYSWSGITPFTPDEADKLVGSYWHLERPARRAFKAMLLRWRQIPNASPSAPAREIAIEKFCA